MSTAMSPRGVGGNQSDETCSQLRTTARYFKHLLNAKNPRGRSEKNNTFISGGGEGALAAYLNHFQKGQ